MVTLYEVMHYTCTVQNNIHVLCKISIVKLYFTTVITCENLSIMSDLSAGGCYTLCVGIYILQFISMQSMSNKALVYAILSREVLSTTLWFAYMWCLFYFFIIFFKYTYNTCSVWFKIPWIKVLPSFYMIRCFATFRF